MAKPKSALFSDSIAVMRDEEVNKELRMHINKAADSNIVEVKIFNVDEKAFADLSKVLKVTDGENSKWVKVLAVVTLWLKD